MDEIRYVVVCCECGSYITTTGVSHMFTSQICQKCGNDCDWLRHRGYRIVKLRKVSDANIWFWTWDDFHWEDMEGNTVTFPLLVGN